MADLSKQIVLSFFDLWTAVKKQKMMILIAALIVGTLGFSYHLTQPIRFTARGILKGKESESKRGILEASFDKFLQSSSFYTPSDDPKTFLRSFPVMKGVVEDLNLQAMITEKKRSFFLKPLWQTFQAEKIRHRLKKQYLPSNILTKNSYVPDHPLFPDEKMFLQCTHVRYSGDIARCFLISFVDSTHFQVLEKKGRSCVGEGDLNHPFKQPWGEFTLRAERPLPKKPFLLTLIPLEQAVNSLQQTIKIKQDKENDSLVHIEYTHKNRHLAASVVNTTMACYQTYLEEEGRRKITHQLKYLHRRFNETMDQLEKVSLQQKGQIEESLHAGEIATFEEELKFLSKTQSQNYKELNKIALEMQGIYQALGEKKVHSFSRLLEQMSQDHHLLSDKAASLTVESANELIAENQHKLDHIQLEKQQYDYCLTKLTDPKFDCSSLSKILNDPSLLPIFEKIHNTHRALIDEKNWTQKEQMQLRENLELEKQYLIRHTNHLKEGLKLQENVVHEQIYSLQKSLLTLLLDRYRFIEQNIKEEVIEKAGHFSQKWIAEGKIALSSEMCREIIESLAKIIESRNIGYHLDGINVTPLKSAKAPMIPDSPLLCLSFTLGSLGGALLAFLGICFREIWLGPSLSYPNLRSSGYKVCGLFSSSHKQRDLKTVRSIIHTLSQKGSLVLINSQYPTTLPETISSLLSKRGEKVLCIDLTASQSPGLLDHLSQEKGSLPLSHHKGSDSLSCGEPMEFKEELLATSRFDKLLITLKKQYDRIFFISNAPAHSTETAHLQALVDTSIYCVHEERFNILESLRSDTLFVLTPVKEFPLLSLAQLSPLVEKLVTRLTQKIAKRG